MEINLVNEWLPSNLLFSNYTIIDIGFEVVHFTGSHQKTFTFIILGLGFHIFWKTYDY